MEEEKANEIEKLQDDLDKAHIHISYLQKENRELKHTTSHEAQKVEGDIFKGPSKTNAQEKGKQVIDVEDMEEPKMKLRKLVTRAARDTTWGKDKMKEAFQAIEKPTFDVWKEYQRFFEEN